MTEEVEGFSFPLHGSDLSRVQIIQLHLELCRLVCTRVAHHQRFIVGVKGEKGAT